MREKPPEEMITLHMQRHNNL